MFTAGSPDSVPSVFNGTELSVCVWRLGVLCAKSPSVLSLGNPINCSPLGSSVHGIHPTRTLLCLPPGDLPDPGIEPAFLTSLELAGRFFTPWGLGSNGEFSKRIPQATSGNGQGGAGNVEEAKKAVGPWDRNLSWAGSVGMESGEWASQRGTRIWWRNIKCDSQTKLVRKPTAF